MTAPSADPYDLKRFLIAQEPVIDQVRTELRVGRKTSHWMWFIFPQIAGLGRSETARFYAIGSRDVQNSRDGIDGRVFKACIAASDFLDYSQRTHGGVCIDVRGST